MESHNSRDSAVRRLMEPIVDRNLQDRLTRQLAHRSHYERGRLASDPEPYRGQAEPRVVAAQSLSNRPPDCSIVMPVYNQEAIIRRTLDHVAANTVGAYELIVIADFCTDQTLLETGHWMRDHLGQHPGLTQVILIAQDTPIFETASDNIGFSIASADWIIEIQADLIIDEHGYNTRLIQPMETYADLIGISGRCSHNFDNSKRIGKCGEAIEHPLTPAIDRDLLYMLGTCNRGPLALRRSMLQSLGYLDERNYYLDDSEHDLFARAYVQSGWRCGYVAIEARSILAEGSTRKIGTSEHNPNTIMNETIRRLKQTTCIHGFLRRHRDALRSVPIETRPLCPL